MGQKGSGWDVGFWLGKEICTFLKRYFFSILEFPLFVFSHDF